MLESYGHFRYKGEDVDKVFLRPIQKIVHYPIETLVQKLREVTMLQEPEVRVYEKAQIEVKTLHSSKMSPPQRYVLGKQIMLLQELDFSLKEQGFDFLHLNGYLDVWFGDNELPVGILPPILEQSIENDGSIHWIICDGMHRCYLSRAYFTAPQVVLISHVPFPYYAYPNPSGWDEVEMIYEEEKGLIKKFHRIRENKKLYRNFVPQFGNLSVPRGRV